MSNHNSIITLGAGRALQFEAKAAEAGIYPGMLIERSSATACLKCNANGTKALALVAIENSINGKDKTTVYANGETVYARALVPGMEVQLILAAGATAVAFGDNLTPNGDGGVKKATAFSQSGTTPFAVTAASDVMFKALEAVDNSAGGTQVFILAQVL